MVEMFSVCFQNFESAKGVVGFSSSPQLESRDGAPAGCFISEDSEGLAIVFNAEDMSAQLQRGTDEGWVCTLRNWISCENTFT